MAYTLFYIYLFYIYLIRYILYFIFFNKIYVFYFFSEFKRSVIILVKYIKVIDKYLSSVVDNLFLFSRCFIIRLIRILEFL